MILRGSKDYEVEKFELIESHGDLRELTIFIDVDNVHSLKKEDDLSVFVDGEYFGKFIVKRINIKQDRAEVKLIDYIAKLAVSYDLFNVSGDYRVEYTNTSASIALDDVLAGTIFSRGYAPNQLITLRGEYENRLKWVQAIANATIYGYDENGNVTTDPALITEVVDNCSWWCDYESNKITIGVAGAIRKGDYWVPIEVDITKKIINVGDVIDDVLKYNKIIVLGYGDGINQIVGSAGSGTPVGVFSDRRLTEVEEANKKAEVLLKNQQQPKKISVVVDPDLAITKAVRLGVLAIIKEPWFIEGTYRIKKIIMRMDSLELNLESDFKDERLSSNFLDIKKALDINNVYLQGVTNVSNFGGGWQAVDSTHPAKWTFYLPDESVGFVRVNECFINVRGRAYRIWSKGAAAGNTGTDANWGDVLEQNDAVSFDPSTISDNVWYDVATLTPNTLEKDIFCILADVNTKFLSPATLSGDCWTSVTYRLVNTTTNEILYTTKAFQWWMKDSIQPQTYPGVLYSFKSGSKNDTYKLQVKFYSVSGKNFSSIDVAYRVLFVSRHDHGTHTHNPEPGIYETSNYPSNVSVKIYNSAYPSGVTVISGITGGADFDQEKVDISSYVTTGKNEIEVTSDTLGMVQVDGFYRIFIKTK